MTPTPTPVTPPDAMPYEVIDDDPATRAENLARHQRAMRNGQYLSDHWADVLPQARGKYVAVANEQLFVADTAEEAWAWVRRTAPEGGGLVEYVRKATGPVNYGNRRVMADQ